MSAQIRAHQDAEAVLADDRLVEYFRVALRLFIFGMVRETANF